MARNNYFNTLTMARKLEELGKCRFMASSEFSGVDRLKGKKVVIVGCGAQGLNNDSIRVGQFSREDLSRGSICNTEHDSSGLRILVNSQDPYETRARPTGGHRRKLNLLGRIPKLARSQP